MVEVLSQYILFINDKLFNSIPFLPFDISLKWQELRQILTVKPLDMDKIRDYTSDLYEMKSSANSIPEERSRKSSKMILKKNSIFAIKHNLSNFGKEPEKDEVNFEGGFEDLVRKNSNNLMLKWRKSVKKQEGGGGMSPVANRYFAKELVEEKPMLKLMVLLLINLFIIYFIVNTNIYNIYLSSNFVFIS